MTLTVLGGSRAVALPVIAAHEPPSRPRANRANAAEGDGRVGGAAPGGRGFGPARPRRGRFAATRARLASARRGMPARDRLLPVSLPDSLGLPIADSQNLGRVSQP